MAELWERMGISQHDFDDLSWKLSLTMTASANRFTRLTHHTEDGYFVAFMASLGIIYFGDHYYLNFQDSKTSPYGVDGPEKIFGCDFGLRVDFHGGSSGTFSKAIIGKRKTTRVNLWKGLSKRKRAYLNSVVQWLRLPLTMLLCSDHLRMVLFLLYT